MDLRHVISIFEVASRQSVAGVTRESILPHDRLEIEGVRYRVAAMHRASPHITSFFASVDTPAALPIEIDLERLAKAYPLVATDHT